jgi:hypothetical protein
MNTKGLKPIDARTMKPGDPVVRSNGATGTLVAYLPEANPSYQAVMLFPQDGRPTACTYDGRFYPNQEYEVFLPPDPDPVDPSPGNADKLRKSQVGEGWRIPAHDEKPDRRAELWVSKSEKWVVVGEWKSVGYLEGITYRVPLAPIRVVPLEMKDFVGKPWPLVRVKRGQAIRAIQAVESPGLSLACRRDPISWAELREDCDISYDLGVTWVKAEKEEQPQ